MKNNRPFGIKGKMIKIKLPSGTLNILSEVLFYIIAYFIVFVYGL